MKKNKAQYKPVPGKKQQKQASVNASIAKLEKWLTVHRLVVILAICLISAGFRAVYYVELRKTHLLEQHLWEESDMSFFDQWARVIVNGNVLSDTALHPVHSWTQHVADQYFLDHPDTLAYFKSKIGYDTINSSPQRLLWNGLYGEKVFHQEPLYAYILALVYKLGGNDVNWMFVCQMLIGIMINVLIYLVARRSFGDLVAVVAAMMAILCGPLVFYELVLLRSTITSFLCILTVYIAGIAVDKNRFFWWVFAGLTCGIAVLSNLFFIMFPLGGMIVLAYKFRNRTKEVVSCLAGGSLGLLLALSPVMIRNAAIGVPGMAMNSTGAISFITENNSSFKSFKGWTIDLNLATQVMGESGGSLLKSIKPTLKSHPDIMSYLGQVWEKFHASFSWFEISNNVNFYFYREFSRVLYFTFISFLIVSPLAIIGIILALYRRKNAWPLFLIVPVVMIPMLAFMVLSRYRITLAPVLMPFAAFAVVELLGTWKKWQNLFIIIGLVPLFFWVAQPDSNEVNKIPANEYLIIYHTHYLKRIIGEADQKNWKGAIHLVTDFLDRYEPGKLKQIKPSYKCENENESQIFQLFSGFYEIRSRLFTADGLENPAADDLQNSALLKQASL